jgi:cytochrome c oxidase subunit 3
MHLSTLLIALLTAVVVWILLVRKLTAKPWIHAVGPGITRDIGTVPHPPTRVGLWVFLCVITSLFSLFITAYMMRMDPHHAGDWSPVDKPAILWLNTLFLIISSLAMQWARAAEKLEQIDRLKIGLAAGGLLTLAFLAGQLVAWQQLHHSDYFQMANPAVGFFYLLTAVHGLHLIGGLWVWSGTTFKVWRTNKISAGSLTVELCTVYWHYLLIVWLILFGLLLST